MLNISKLRKIDPKIITVGVHPGIIQSILDFDYLAGKREPSIIGAISFGKKFERFFWGTTEVILPLFPDFESLPADVSESANMLLNFSSGRRAASSTIEAAAKLQNLQLVSVFAEEVAEQDALAIWDKVQTTVIGPASVGLLIPNQLKLGAIAGVQAVQLLSARAFTPGGVAVFSASGGMTNELINLVTAQKGALSFSLSFGGDRFPVLTPREAVEAAEADPETKLIVYYGELGGIDEYEIAELASSGKLTKPLIAYIAGVVSAMFDKPTQFGHAKAMAGSQEQSAQAKREALRNAGIVVAESYKDLSMLIGKNIKKLKLEVADSASTSLEGQVELMKNRNGALFISRLSGEMEGDVKILGEDLLEFSGAKSVGGVVASLLLGKLKVSKTLEEFTELALKLMVDHGPYQSAAVNTMVAARANKDLVSSMAAGLLTIGDRFGGAINGAAKTWFEGVDKGLDPAELVESFAARKEYILGIGHRKYRLGMPDPRVEKLLGFRAQLKDSKYTQFALDVAKITSAKKANLILNVDGVLAALLLDILTEQEGYSSSQIGQEIEIGLFNAYFVLARSIGLAGHYLDQRRLDEGLFRLDPRQVATVR